MSSAAPLPQHLLEVIDVPRTRFQPPGSHKATESTLEASQAPPLGCLLYFAHIETKLPHGKEKGPNTLKNALSHMQAFCCWGGLLPQNKRPRQIGHSACHLAGAHRHLRSFVFV